MRKTRVLQMVVAALLVMAVALPAAPAAGQDGDYGALSRAMEELVGGWYSFAGGMMYTVYVEFYADGTCAGFVAEPDSIVGDASRDWANPALYTDIIPGIWYIAPYNPGQNLFWNTPPFLLTIVENSGVSCRYGLNMYADAFSLSTEEGEGGYVRYGGPPSGGGTQDGNGTQGGDGTQQNNDGNTQNNGDGTLNNDGNTQNNDGNTQNNGDGTQNNGETQSLAELRAQIAGGWYMDIGGALLMDYFELGADGSVSAYTVDASRIAPDYYSTNWPDIVLREGAKHGTWDVQPYDPAVYRCWNDPPWLLMVRSGPDTVEYYGLEAPSTDSLCLSDSMGQGGYRRYLGPGGTEGSNGLDADDGDDFFHMDYFYRVTDGWYSDSQAMMGVLEEFGQYGEMADWNEITSLYGDRMTAFMDEAGVDTDVDVWVQRGGSRYDGSRHYFLARISAPRTNFKLYDSVGNEAWLGSWYGVQMPVLVKVPADQR